MPTRKDPGVDKDNFDRGIEPAETAARKEREGDDYKKTPKDESSNTESTEGYTTSNEGLTNNYAIEPEMYVETPGDIPEEEQPKT